MLQQALHPEHVRNMDGESKETFSELYVPLQFAADMRSGMFTMTAQEYREIPATMLDFIHLYRTEKAIIESTPNGNADE